MERMVVGIIVGIGFFQQKWPNFERHRIVGVEAVEEGGYRLSPAVPNRNIIVNDNAFPYVLLKNFDKIHSVFAEL